MRDGYFLLSRKNEYAIYDVSTQEITRTFTIEGDAFAGTIYVLGSDGQMLLETKEDVIYADEEGYLIWDVTGKYQIQSYKTQVPG